MKSLWLIIIFGVILRVVLSLTTYHTDMQVFDIAGRLIASGNILNLYNFSSNSAVFNYPPAIYLFHGLFRFLFDGILGFSIVKFPYLIFDLLTGFILFKLFNDRKKSLLAFSLWMFNPISLYATYMMGQFDIIPTFFIILSVYYVLKNKLEWAALSLGLGIAFKLSPIFLVIPLVVAGKTLWQRFRLIILSIAPYALLIIPYLPSSTFRSTALFASQSSKSLYANISVSGGEVIILFPLVLIIYYIFIWVNKVRSDIVKLYVIPLLLFFIFTHYHPQWLIWITPLLILDLVTNGFKNLLPTVIIFVSWLLSLFFFDPSMTVGIFPAFSHLLSIWALLHLTPDYNFSRSIIQTVFAGAALYLIYIYFPVKDADK